MRIEPLLQNNQSIPPDKDIKKAATEFESFFAAYLLKVMRESVPKSGLLNAGMSEEIYTSMIDEKVAEGIATQGGLGLAHFIGRQINIHSLNADKVANHQEVKEHEDKRA